MSNSGSDARASPLKRFTPSHSQRSAVVGPRQESVDSPQKLPFVLSPLPAVVAVVVVWAAAALAMAGVEGGGRRAFVRLRNETWRPLSFHFTKEKHTDGIEAVGLQCLDSDRSGKGCKARRLCPHSFRSIDALEEAGTRGGGGSRDADRSQRACSRQAPSSRTLLAACRPVCRQWFETDAWRGSLAFYYRISDRGKRAALQIPGKLRSGRETDRFRPGGDDGDGDGDGRGPVHPPVRGQGAAGRGGGDNVRGAARGRRFAIPRPRRRGRGVPQRRARSQGQDQVQEARVQGLHQLVSPTPTPLFSPQRQICALADSLSLAWPVFVPSMSRGGRGSAACAGS